MVFLSIGAWTAGSDVAAPARVATARASRWRPPAVATRQRSAARVRRGSGRAGARGTIDHDGIDVLRAELQGTRGMRVGLVTNHTGRARGGDGDDLSRGANVG
jgi:hypothetical protein